MRVLKVIDAPCFKIIDGTGAFSTASAKLLRNRRFRSSYLGHAHAAVKALAALSRINLAAVDVAIRALQFEDLADCVAALEERAKRNDMQGFER
jgi:hypothetical protein